MSTSNDHRQWLPLSARCTIAALTGIALIAFLNIPGDRYELERTGSEWAFVEFTDHGWPWTYLTRREDFDQTPHPPISIWQFTTHIESFSPLWLALNVVVVLLAWMPVAWWLARANLVPSFKGQFSLRGLLVATALSGMALGASVYLVGKYREHRQFVGALRELNASVSVVPGGPDWLRDLLPSDYRIFDSYDSIELRGKELSPILTADEPNNAFARMCACPGKMAGMLSLRIEDCKAFNDEHLALLRHARGLQDLQVNNSGVTGEGFASLAVLPSLRYLRFSNTPVTDASLHHLDRIPQLQAAGWDGSKISPEAAAKLRMRYSKWGPIKY
jgi:hypothetical protein